MYTVVVVDDEEELRRTIIRRIDWEGIGFHVVGEAANGIEALEQVETREPDLLLTDIRMPFLSGLELAKQVREIRPATNIAFLSGYDDFAYAKEAIEYNIISYILKPLTMSALTEELIRIRDKLDKFFEEFSEKHAGLQDISEFAIPLVLDGYMPEFLQSYGSAAGSEGTGIVSGTSKVSDTGKASDVGIALGSGNAPWPVRASGTGIALGTGKVSGEGKASGTGIASDTSIASGTGKVPGTGTVPNRGNTRRPGSSREYSLLRQAEACGLIKSARAPIAYVVMSAILLDGSGSNITGREHVHSIESIVRKYIGGFHFYSGRKIVSLLIAPQEALREYLHIAADEISQDTKRILGLHSRIGISRIMNRLSDCHEAYKDAVEALRYNPKAGGSIRYTSDGRLPGGEAIDLLMRIASDLENFMRIGDAHDALEYFGSVRGELAGARADQAMIRLFMVRLMSAGSQVLYSSGDPEAVFRLEETQDLGRMAAFNGTLEDAVDDAERFCIAVIEQVSDRREKSSSNICNKALMLIDKNYMDPELSLASLSSMVGVSPNYLSTLIKKGRNKTFTDCLTERRMEAARQLLLSTDMKIREIAERCGYRDQHYFSYSFRKYTGDSPAGLRQKHRT